MSYERFLQGPPEAHWEEEETEVEKVPLEIARQSWQRVSEILCHPVPELEDERIGVLVDHLSICVSFLDNVEGVGRGVAPHEIKNELVRGVYVGDFQDFLISRGELFDDAVCSPNDKLVCWLELGRVKMEFSFIKTTDKDGRISVENDMELKYPGKWFYRKAWEEMQEKLAALKG